MKKLSILALLFSLSISGNAFEVFQVGKRPESAVKGFNEDVFVTVMGAPEEGNATIQRIDKEGNVSLFAKGLKEPKGITYKNNLLLVADLDQIVSINDQGKVKVIATAEKFNAEHLFVNDIQPIDGEDALYVSNSGYIENIFDESGNLWPLSSEEAKKVKSAGGVYKVTLDGEVTKMFGGSEFLKVPNGIELDREGRLIVLDFFTGNLCRFDGEALEVIASGFRGGDEVFQLKDGSFYISSWTQGKIWSVNLDSGERSIVLRTEKGTADFYFDAETNIIWCPSMLAGKLYKVSL